MNWIAPMMIFLLDIVAIVGVIYMIRLIDKYRNGNDYFKVRFYSQFNGREKTLWFKK